MSLFARFFLILIAFAMTPVLATGVWFLRSNQRVEENSRQLHAQLAGLSTDIVESSVGRLNRALAFVEDLERAGPAAKDSALYAILQRAAVTYPAFALLSIVGPDGKETLRVADASVYETEKTADRSGDKVIEAARKSGRVSIGLVEIRDGKPLATLAHPLSRGRTAFVVYSFADLWKRLASMRVGTEGRILLVDAGGKPLAGMGQGLIEPDWSAPLAADKRGWFEALRVGDRAMVGAYEVTPSLGWRVLTLQPKDEAFAVGDGFVFRVVTFLIFLAGIVLFATYTITRKLTEPLQALIAGAQRASRHEFGHAVPPVGWGELNVLSKAFNDLMKDLQRYEELQVDRILSEKAKVEALVSNIPDGIVLASFDGKILYMNASARSLLAANANETMPPKLSVREAFRNPTLQEMSQQLLKGRKKSDTAEIEINPGDKRRGIYFVRGVTVTQEKKEVGILILMRDVTAERELDKMKEEFFHSIVHDIRGPLGTIDGFVQIMRERKALPEKEMMYIGYIEGSCDRLRQLVNDILDSAKIESGTLTLKKEPLSVEDFLAHMETLYRLQAEQRKIELVLDRGAAPPRPLQCDKELTERVAMNLIGNAMKFTPKGGKITVHAGYEAGEMVFFVADNGPGIPKDKAALVFEKFKQLDGPQQRSGYGLGLSICKKVVELHGGRIWVESDTGKGSKFIFRMPLGS